MKIGREYELRNTSLWKLEKERRKKEVKKERKRTYYLLVLLGGNMAHDTNTTLILTHLHSSDFWPPEQ